MSFRFIADFRWRIKEDVLFPHRKGLPEVDMAWSYFKIIEVVIWKLLFMTTLK